MFLTYEEFSQRAQAITAEIAQACEQAGRTATEVQLLAVTKTHPSQAADYAARFGLKAVGENRVQEGVEKRARATEQIQWELIGHLQSNKARLAAQHFDRVQSVDREKMVDLLDKASAELGKTLPILIQVNAGRDPAKFGAELEDAPRLVAYALSKKNLRVDGLMTIPPLSADLSTAERTFATLRELRDRLREQTGAPLAELSMGMSGDFALAIAAGSTVVRIGTALFGSRDAAPQ